MDAGGIVSPENSEDGVLPTVADINNNFQHQQHLQQPNFQHQQQQFAMPTVTSQQQYDPNSFAGIPLAPMPQQTTATTFPQLPAQVPNNNNNNTMQMDFLNHGAPQAALAPAVAQQQAPKRRRAQDGGAIPMMANNHMNAHPDPATFLSGQQLAAAAAQALQGRGRKKSQAQIDRRRERNRILARRTRLRKKFFFESLQKEVMDLQKQNELLKETVRQNIDEDEAKKILDDCDAVEKLPPSVLESINESSGISGEDFNLVTSIQRSQHAFLITDPSLQDNPIVFASEGFLQLTGYAREQVLGRNCRFLQGTDTSPEKVKQMQTAISKGEDVSVTLINYTADGTAFWNKLFIAALRDAQNSIVNYIGVLVKVACPEPGDPDHGKTLPGAGTSKKKSNEDDDDNSGDEDDDDAST